MIYALHGFLGEGKDWSALAVDQMITPSYFSDPQFTSLSLENFVTDIKSYPQRSKMFVGYSLGGRIGLQILEAQPDLFEHYVFISTHPGLKDEAERKSRLQNDQQWIEKLEKLSWDDFLTAWNQQTVLAASMTAPKSSELFFKDRLIMALSARSLGQQADYSSLIQRYQDRITWVVGAQDEKFLKIAEDLQQKKILLETKRILAGHRILLDNPTDLKTLLQQVFVHQQPV